MKTADSSGDHRGPYSPRDRAGINRIKAVLTGPDHAPIAVGNHDWENQFVDRTWTYSLEAVWAGLQECYAAVAAQFDNATTSTSPRWAR